MEETKEHGAVMSSSQQVSAAGLLQARDKGCFWQRSTEACHTPIYGDFAISPYDS
jgi:hypothetical protein